MPAIDDARILNEIPLFEGLAEGDLSAVNNLMHRKTFSSGVNIITVAQPGDMVYILMEGTVKIYVDQLDGSEVIQIYAQPDDETRPTPLRSAGRELGHPPADEGAGEVVLVAEDGDLRRDDGRREARLLDDGDDDVGVGEERRRPAVEDAHLQDEARRALAVEARGGRAQGAVGVHAEGAAVVARPHVEGEGGAVGGRVGVGHVEAEDGGAGRAVLLHEGAVVAAGEQRGVVVGVGDVHVDQDGGGARVRLAMVAGKDL